jgi:hypothetical protein
MCQLLFAVRGSKVPALIQVSMHQSRYPFEESRGQISISGSRSFVDKFLTLGASSDSSAAMWWRNCKSGVVVRGVGIVPGSVRWFFSGVKWIPRGIGS